MKIDRELDEATKAELKRLELLLMDPAMRRERERVAGLLIEDFLVFGSSGRVWTRETTHGVVATETYTPPAVDSFCMQNAGQRRCARDLSRVRTTGAKDELTVTLRSSIWARKSGRCKICFHQGTRRTNPRKLME